MAAVSGWVTPRWLPDHPSICASYPAGLAGDAIPIEGRIAAVADVYDAVTSERPYKRAWTQAETLAEIERSAGSHFDPVVATALQALFADALPPFIADVTSEPSEDAPRTAGPVAERAPSLAQ